METSGGVTEGVDASSGGTADVCGDGVVGPQELCDDGDDEDGDGCNVDCLPSGMQLWMVEVLPSQEATNDQPKLTLAGDRVALVDFRVEQAGGSFLRQWHMRIYDREGTEQWADVLPPTPMEDGDLITGGTGLVDGSLAITYFANGMVPTRIRKYTPEGTIAWDIDPDPALGVSGLVAQPAGMIAVGSDLDTGGWLAGYSLEGEEAWRAMTGSSDPYVSLAANPEGGLAMLTSAPRSTLGLLAFDPQGASLGQSSFSAGTTVFLGAAPNGFGYWVSELSVEGFVLARHGTDAQEQLSIDVMDAPGVLAGMPDGGVVVGSTSETGLEHLRRYDPAGTLRWDMPLPSGDSTIYSIAAAPDGFIWVAGLDGASGSSRVWLSAVTP